MHSPFMLGSPPSVHAFDGLRQDTTELARSYRMQESITTEHRSGKRVDMVRGSERLSVKSSEQWILYMITSTDRSTTVYVR